MKHRLSKREQARGLRNALRSRRTPRWLKPSIRRSLRKLEREIREGGHPSAAPAPAEPATGPGDSQVAGTVQELPVPSGELGGGAIPKRC